MQLACFLFLNFYARKFSVVFSFMPNVTYPACVHLGLLSTIRRSVDARNITSTTNIVRLLQRCLFPAGR